MIYKSVFEIGCKGNAFLSISDIAFIEKSVRFVFLFIFATVFTRFLTLLCHGLTRFNTVFDFVLPRFYTVLTRLNALKSK